VFVLFVCGVLAQGRPSKTSATIALVPHFEMPSGDRLIHWLAPMIAQVFRPAGLSLEWYDNREAVPANIVRTLDVSFHGTCWPMSARSSRISSLSFGRLGWVFSHDGQIADEVAVDCAQVMHLAADARNTTTDGPLLELVYLRLMERVMAHELLHVLLLSRGHGRSEFSRPRMQASDWRGIGHLTTSELRSLRQLYGPEAPVAWTENR
jgi:hypothetical protein